MNLYDFIYSAKEHTNFHLFTYADDDTNGTKLEQFFWGSREKALKLELDNFTVDKFEVKHNYLVVIIYL